LAKEQHAVQPAQTVAPHSVNPDLMRSHLDASPVLTHQSKSYPGGQPHLARTPSVSSQGSLDSGASRQVTGPRCTTQAVWCWVVEQLPHVQFSSQPLEAATEQRLVKTEDFMCAVVIVLCGVRKSVRLS
jgi:hypothetical protein